MRLREGGVAGMRRISRTVTVAAPVHRVWAAVGDERSLSRWMGAVFDVALRPGGAGVATLPGGRRLVRVVAVEPGHRLAFRWWPAEDRPDAEPPSEVEVRLRPEGASTQVFVTEVVLADLDTPSAGRALAEAGA